MRPLAFILLVLLSACGDDQPPRILQASLPVETTDAAGPFVITAVVTDNRVVKDVNLLMTSSLNVAHIAQRMLAAGESVYETSIGPFSPGSVQHLIIEASDQDGNRSWYPHPELSMETGCVVKGDLCWQKFFVME